MFFQGFIGHKCTKREREWGQVFRVYDGAFTLWAICCQRKREYVFHCECEWPGADLSWATPSVSHPRKLTWPWVGCPGKARALRTCYRIPHGIHTSHISRREIHPYVHTRTHNQNMIHRVDTHTHTRLYIHSLKCFPSHAFSFWNSHTRTHIHIHHIPRNPQRGKDRLARGREKRKKALFIVFRPFISFRLGEGGAQGGCRQ